MAFVRKKRVGQYEYYQVVENRRVDGKTRQRVVLHLGHHPTVDAALAGWTKEIERLRRVAGKDAFGKRSDTWNYRPLVYSEDLVPPDTDAERRLEELQGKLDKLRDLKERGMV